MKKSAELMRIAKKFFLASALTIAMPAYAQDIETNTEILLNAQSDYQPLMRDAADDYSGRLSKLELLLNARLKPLSSLYTHIAILDPIKLDIAKAIGITNTMAVQTLLLQKRIFPHPALVSLTQDFMITTTPIASGGNSYTQNPHALFLWNDEKRVEGACIIIPSPANTIPQPLKIPNLTTTESTDFSNTHEGWHCLDNIYYTKFFTPEVYQSFNPKDITTLLTSDIGREAYVNQHRSEVFADVATIGDMIRSGKYDVSLVDKVANWRENQFEDLIHYTTPVLLAFKDKIKELGLRKFRSLTDQQAVEFYYNVIEEHALNARSLEIKIRRDMNERDFSGQINDKDAMRRAAAYKHTSLAKNETEIVAVFTSILGGPGLNEEDISRSKHVIDILVEWKPFEDLQARARQIGGSVTPQTLSTAYVDYMKELYRLTISDAVNADLYIEKATRLKKAFVEETMYFEYNAEKPLLVPN